MTYYDKISGGYDELHKEEQLNKLKIIKSSLKINKNSRLLDIGCGTGISSDFECFVVGIDPSIELLKRNNKTMKINGIAETLPFKDGVFDCVISVTALHNFNDLEKSLEEITRVGKNNFVFSVLRKSGNFSKIKNLINNNFKIQATMEEEKDTIFFCSRP